MASVAPLEPTRSHTLVFRVDDMTCAHCAGSITAAIARALPNAKVSADPASKLVIVTGAPDAALLAAIMRDAGYTPAIA